MKKYVFLKKICKSKILTKHHIDENICVLKMFAHCLSSKIPIFQKAGISEWGLPLPPAFQYLIPMTLKSLWFEFGCDIFSCFMKWNWRHLSLNSWHFETSKDIKTKFKSQALHIFRIKYWNARESCNPPSLITALWNIVILINKQVTLGKHFEPECIKRGHFYDRICNSL